MTPRAWRSSLTLAGLFWVGLALVITGVPDMLLALAIAFPLAGTVLVVAALVVLRWLERHADARRYAAAMRLARWLEERALARAQARVEAAAAELARITRVPRIVVDHHPGRLISAAELASRANHPAGSNLRPTVTPAPHVPFVAPGSQKRHGRLLSRQNANGTGVATPAQRSSGGAHRPRPGVQNWTPTPALEPTLPRSNTPADVLAWRQAERARLALLAEANHLERIPHGPAQ